MPHQTSTPRFRFVIQVCAGEAGCHAGESPAGRVRLFTTESCVSEEAARPKASEAKAQPAHGNMQDQASGRRDGLNYGQARSTSPTELSTKLRAAIESFQQNPTEANAYAIATKLKREDPPLFTEFVKWLQSQQSN